MILGVCNVRSYQQRFPLGLLILFIFLVATCNLAAQPIQVGGEKSDSSIQVGEIRATIQKSIPYIEKEGAAWIKKRKCTSCHQIPAMTWALNRAVALNFEVDEDAHERWDKWSKEWINLLDPKFQKDATKSETLKNENDAIAGLLLGRMVEEEIPSWVNQYVEGLAQGQQDDGSWKPQGQLPLQKRPSSETQQVSTRWAVLALVNNGGDSQAAKIDKASKYLEKSKPGISTEWWATKLLIECQSSNSEDAKVTREKLVEFQNEDGGWGWLVDEQSDAFGTGLATYALLKGGETRESDSVRKAIRFLIESQELNGSWKVNGTKKNKRYRPTPTANYWGTCWAAIALMESLEAYNEKK